MLYKGESANEVWKQIMQGLSLQSQTQDGRGGATKELLHVMISIKDPRQRWTVSRRPAINPAFALVEVVWILRGRDDSKFVNNWNSQLKKFSGDGPKYHGAYGKRLGYTFGLDQLEQAYFALLNNPQSRQVVLQLWDPRIDFPDQQGKPVAADIPCNVNSMLKVRDGYLEWMQVLRSNDVILGLPYNIIQFTTLQEVMAGWLGLKVGSYNQLSDSLHLYVKHLDKFESHSPNQELENTDCLNLPKDLSDEVFRNLERIIESIAESTISERVLLERISGADMPNSYRNILRMIGAEKSRREDWIDLKRQLIEEVSNPALRQAWHLWDSRF